MATATFAEEVKDKTREELVEACFKVHLELRILVARKTGGQEPQRVAFATEKFKQKLENKAREEIISLYLQACEKIKKHQEGRRLRTPTAEKTTQGGS